MASDRWRILCKALTADLGFALCSTLQSNRQRVRRGEARSRPRPAATAVSGQASSGAPTEGDGRPAHGKDNGDGGGRGRRRRRKVRQDDMRGFLSSYARWGEGTLTADSEDSLPAPYDAWSWLGVCAKRRPRVAVDRWKKMARGGTPRRPRQRCRQGKGRVGGPHGRGRRQRRITGGGRPRQPAAVRGAFIVGRRRLMRRTPRSRRQGRQPQPVGQRPARPTTRNQLHDSAWGILRWRARLGKDRHVPRGCHFQDLDVAAIGSGGSFPCQYATSVRGT